MIVWQIGAVVAISLQCQRVFCDGGRAATPVLALPVSIETSAATFWSWCWIGVLFFQPVPHLVFRCEDPIRKTLSNGLDLHLVVFIQVLLSVGCLYERKDVLDVVVEYGVDSGE